MIAVRRRWQSIDRKLPLLTSGLVVLTAVLLAVVSYILVERALIDAAGKRLYGSAAAVTQLISSPRSMPMDVVRATDAVLRDYVAGRASRELAVAALARGTSSMDSLKVYGALLDSSGRPVVEYRRHPRRPAPRWPAEAIARGELADSLSVGPFENLDGVALTMAHRLRADTGASSPVIGYVVNTRAVSGRNANRIRQTIGHDVRMLVGQPDAGVWSDLPALAESPTAAEIADSIVVHPRGVSAMAPVIGTNLKVWVSQSRSAVLAPARTLLWTVIPVGLAIALAGAAITWRYTRGMTRRIVQLTDAAENIASDNGDHRMQPTVLMPITNDEVARLRYAFERMARRVAERQTLEMQLRHAMKMEAVGRLAGGVAHDFNNLLTAIRSYADLLIADTPEWDSKRQDLIEIRKASERAAALTSQLLAYSRKQMLQPRVLDTREVLTDLEGMLKRILGEDTALRLDVAPDVWSVKVDRGQLEQVIVNLTVNARDAMPQGGTVRVSALNDTLEHPVETRLGEVPAGQYVSISVTDTGVGMDAKIQSQVFEPFFTTKPMGQGTGLGLSTVHGIVAQSGGHVTVQSAPGQGTTFTVYLPRVLETPSSDRRSGPRTVAKHSGSETILLVEDESAVRSLARRVLERTGYTVLEAAIPGVALAMAEKHRDDIDLVLSDVVMPEMSGPQLVAKISQICPDARVLFISGYTDDEIIGRGLSDPGLLLLPKPFSAQELVDRVRQALDRPQESASATLT
jgi:signal transduction histidine kinase/ActR/RegA family two-component response regulator